MPLALPKRLTATQLEQEVRLYADRVGVQLPAHLNVTFEARNSTGSTDGVRNIYIGDYGGADADNDPLWLRSTAPEQAAFRSGLILHELGHWRQKLDVVAEAGYREEYGLSRTVWNIVLDIDAESRIVARWPQAVGHLAAIRQPSINAYARQPDLYTGMDNIVMSIRFGGQGIWTPCEQAEWLNEAIRKMMAEPDPLAARLGIYAVIKANTKTPDVREEQQ